MKVTGIEYKRVVNLGNFESEHLGVTVEVDEENTPEEALAWAREFVANSVSDPGHRKRVALSMGMKEDSAGRYFLPEADNADNSDVEL